MMTRLFPREACGLLGAVLAVAGIAFFTTLGLAGFRYAPGPLLDPTLLVTAMGIPLLILIILPVHLYCRRHALSAFRHYAAGMAIIVSLFYFLIPPTLFPTMGYRRSGMEGMIQGAVRMPGEPIASNALGRMENVSGRMERASSSRLTLPEEEMDKVGSTLFHGSKKDLADLKRAMEKAEALNAIPPAGEENMMPDILPEPPPGKPIASFLALVRFGNVIALYLAGLLCMFVFWRVAVYPSSSSDGTK